MGLTTTSEDWANFVLNHYLSGHGGRGWRMDLLGWLDHDTIGIRDELRRALAAEVDPVKRADYTALLLGV